MTISGSTRPAAHSPDRRYVFRTLFCMSIYALLNIGAIWGVFDDWIGTPTGWFLALAVALPLAGQIWALLRLVADSDEYMRVIWAKRFILSAGIAMVICSVWGFGETYANAPAMSAWLIFPLFWAISAVVWPFVRSSR